MEKPLLVCVVVFVVAFITTRLTVIGIYRKIEEQQDRVEDQLLAAARAESKAAEMRQPAVPTAPPTSEPAKAFRKAAGA